MLLIHYTDSEDRMDTETVPGMTAYQCSTRNLDPQVKSLLAVTRPVLYQMPFQSAGGPVLSGIHDRDTR
jgi:hypothetical protein